MSYNIHRLHSQGLPKLLEGIHTEEEWQNKRERILEIWMSCIGGLPKPVSVEWEILSEVQMADHKRVHLVYHSVFGDKVTAYLLLPEGMKLNQLDYSSTDAAGMRVKQLGRLGDEGRSVGEAVGPVAEDGAASVASRESGSAGTVASSRASGVVHRSGETEVRKYPAVLALHPTSEVGKDAVVSREVKENRQYGLELVSRGYVVLAPDALTAGERILQGSKAFESKNFYDLHPDWTVVSKTIIDHIQGIDLLCSLEVVDAGRIGAIGHSFGGYNAFFLAGLDERIRAYVCSCGFGSFYGDPRPTRWGKRDWYSHLPKINDYLSRYEFPFEFHEIAALAAPTPAFYYFGQQDSIFPHWQAIGECMYDLNELYAFLGEETQFEAVMSAEGHDFPADVRSLAYAFLDRWLK